MKRTGFTTGSRHNSKSATVAGIRGEEFQLSRRPDPNLTADAVKKLSPEKAKEIYRTAYWNRMQCGELPPGLDLEVFDFGVNSGPAESVKTLQRIVGVTQDGSIGPITLAAVGQFNIDDLISRFAQARLA